MGAREDGQKAKKIGKITLRNKRKQRETMRLKAKKEWREVKAIQRRDGYKVNGTGVRDIEEDTGSLHCSRPGIVLHPPLPVP